MRKKVNKKRESMSNDKRSSVDERFRSDSKSNNDPQWYSGNNVLLSNVASIPFNVPLGTTLPFGKSDKYQSPGVLAIYWDPAVGPNAESGSEESAINQAARILYAYVRKGKSGSTSYDVPDLMLYVLAVSEAYGTWAWLRRLYGLLNSYSALNAYYPKAIVECLGVDYDDCLTHMSEMRTYINNLAVQLGTKPIPAVFPYVQKRMWLNSYVYTDSPSLKGQVYVFNQRNTWNYKPDYDTKGGGLTATPFIDLGSHIKWQTIKDRVNSVMNPLMQDEDIRNMSGDIMYAFPNDLMATDMLADDYVVFPEYNPEVLPQFHNAIMVDRGKVDLHQSAQGALMEGDFSITQDAFKSYSLVDTIVESPTPEMVMEMTRTMAMSEPIDASGSIWTYGSEWYCGYQMKTSVSDEARGATLAQISESASAANIIKNFERIAAMQAFDYCPRQIVNLHVTSKATTGGGLAESNKVFWTTNNVRTLSYQELKALHTNAMLGLFAVPALGGIK